MSLGLPENPPKLFPRIERLEFVQQLFKIYEREGAKVEPIYQDSIAAYLIKRGKIWLFIEELPDSYTLLESGIYDKGNRMAPTSRGAIAPTGALIGNAQFISEKIIELSTIRQTINDVRHYIQTCINEGEHTALGWDIYSNSGVVVWNNTSWISLKNSRDGSITLRLDDINRPEQKDPSTKKIINPAPTKIRPTDLKINFSARQILSMLETVEEVEPGELFQIFKPN